MPGKTISSRQNPLVARYRAVARGEMPGVLLLDGVHLVAEALAAGAPIRHVAVKTDALKITEIGSLVDTLTRSKADVVAVSAPVMDALSPVRSSSTIVALADRPEVSEDALHGARALIVIAIDIQDPGNVGAIVRVAEAGGATGVIAAGASANPFGWKALRGSMGSALRLPVIARPDADRAVADARARGCRIIATAPRGGRPLVDAPLSGPAAILIGGEGPGLPPMLVERADERVTIPMRPPVESLNAAVTAALIVYEAQRQRTVRRA
jgi:TrmH family RNA methyltransferase